MIRPIKALSSVFKWIDCKLTHRRWWTRTPVYHSYDYRCGMCGRKWTVED
jgi:hypothetical protein